MRPPWRVALALIVACYGLGEAEARSPGQGALDEGVARYRDGDFRHAAESFRRAVELDPSLMKAWENLGWAQHRLGHDDEALRIWNTVLKLEPRNIEALNAVGEVELGRGSWGAAAAAFERSLARTSDQPDVRLRLGQAYEQLGRPEKAEGQYRAILERHRNDPKATQRLADVYEAKGQLAEAEALLREAIARRPDPDGVFTKRLARVLARKGDAAYAAEDWTTARDDYRDAAQWDATQPRYLANLGWAERRAGANRAAIDAWTNAIDRGVPEPAELWRAIGDAALEEGLTENARTAYSNAARLDPHAAGALYPLAAMALDRGAVTEAVAMLDDMFSKKDLHDEDYIRTADLFIRDDALDAGEAFFERQSRQPGRSIPAGVGLGRLFAARGGAAYRAGDDAVAAGFYRKALASDPRCRAALRDFGWVLWRQASWDEALRVWSDYARAYPEAPEPHELLARLHLQRSEPRRAIEDAEAALALGPADAKPAKMLLAKAWLANGKFQRARGLAAELASAYPDDLAVQVLYGETLWRNLDFTAAKVQWRKVLDLGSDSPRAMHYWLRSMYETGEYDEAVAQALRIAAEPGASEPVLRLLAEDATLREDDAGAVRWYRRLTEQWPQRVPYWIALCETYRRAQKPRAVERTLAKALRAHPDDPELSLLLADTHRSLGRPARALKEYDALAERLGKNRTVLLGRVHALNDLGREEEALTALRGMDQGMLTPDELALEEATILEELGRRSEAATTRASIAVRNGGRVEVPMLLYHGLTDQERTLNMPVDHFDEQMRMIRDAGYTTITVADLDRMLAGSRPFPAKPILVTFDDARADSFRFADPVLARYGMRATMFVPTVRIADESASNSDWARLRELAATGRWDFQSHGHLAHDPIPIDDSGAIAEFLVNREWLREAARLETHDEFAARVDGDYALCRRLLEDNLPGGDIVGYAFPFSEMGQLHGGNDPQALAVNERAFGEHYRYGFIQDESGANTLAPGMTLPLLLRRLNVPREWGGDRLAAQLAIANPESQVRLDGAKWDLWSGRLRQAEAEFRAILRDNPQTAGEASVYLARTLQEEDRPRAAMASLETAPTGPGWERPDPFRRKLERELAWENDPLAGLESGVVSDSDGRDQFEAAITGRYPFEAPVDLRAAAGTVRFEDPVYPELDGSELTLGVRWQAFDQGAFGGWIRGRNLSGGVSSLNGELSYDGRIDNHRFGVACGVEDVPTVGALREAILARGCELAYQTSGRLWRSRARAAFRGLTDGNAIVTAWGDGTRALGRRRWVEIGGRAEIGDAAETSPLYYAPQQVVTLLALARTVRSFPSGSSIDAEIGAGPSHDATTGTRFVGHVRVGWTQNWTLRFRTTLTGEYGQTPDYHRTSLGVAFGYRF